MEFNDYLMQEYRLSAKSASDYVGRFNGIVAKGIYKGESHITPSMEAAIEKEYGKSKGHYILTLKRFLHFKKEFL